VGSIVGVGTKSGLGKEIIEYQMVLMGMGID
jgi:hypothetical protein